MGLKKDGTIVIGVWAWRKVKPGEEPTWPHQPDRVIDTFEIGSQNGGKTWQRLGPLPSETVSFFRYISWCYGEVRRLADGSLIRPCYGPDVVTEEKFWSVVCLRSEDEGVSWSGYRVVDARKYGTRCNETDFLELPDGRILAVVRNPEAGTDPLCLYSTDGGKTWGDESYLGFFMSCPCLHLLSDRRILLLCRSKDEDGGGFFGVISEDFGQTWKARQRLVKGGLDSGYPTAFSLSEGQVLAVGYVETGKNNCEVVALTLEISD
jgi:hypothetical protein